MRGAGTFEIERVCPAPLGKGDPSALDLSTNVERMRILYGRRAVIIADERKRYLVVSDLHIGFEEKFRGAGISLESRIDKLSNELRELVEWEKITDLLIDGDVKSGTDRITRSEWDNVPAFFEKMLKYCRVSVVPGNHDGGLQHLLPSGVTLLDSNGVKVSKTLIIHGQTRPLAKFRDCDHLIMGHVHPIYQRKGSPLSGQPVWVFLKVGKRFVFKGEPGTIEDREGERGKSNDEDGAEYIRITMMPSFNLELVVAGYAVDAAKQERKIAPILRDIEGKASEGMVVTLDGDLIGDVSLVSSIL